MGNCASGAAAHVRDEQHAERPGKEQAAHVGTWQGEKQRFSAAGGDGQGSHPSSHESSRAGSRRNSFSSSGGSRPGSGSNGAGGSMSKVAPMLDADVSRWPRWLASLARQVAASRRQPLRSIDDFERVAKIGEGTYSIVYKGVDRASGEVVALKRVQFDPFDAEALAFISREVRILTRLRHENIVELRAVVASRKPNALYLIFEYLPHDLQALMGSTRGSALLLGKTRYGSEVDMWSVGAMLAELVVGRPMLPGRTEVEQLHRIWKLCGTPPESYWDSMARSGYARDAMLMRPPSSYPDRLESVLREKGLEAPTVALVRALMSYDSSRRSSAGEALAHGYFSRGTRMADPIEMPLAPDSHKAIPIRRAPTHRRNGDARLRDANAPHANGRSEGAARRHRRQSSGAIAAEGNVTGAHPGRPPMDAQDLTRSKTFSHPSHPQPRRSRDRPSSGGLRKVSTSDGKGEAHGAVPVRQVPDFAAALAGPEVSAPAPSLRPSASAGNPPSGGGLVAGVALGRQPRNSRMESPLRLVSDTRTSLSSASARMSVEEAQNGGQMRLNDLCHAGAARAFAQTQGENGASPSRRSVSRDPAAHRDRRSCSNMPEALHPRARAAPRHSTTALVTDPVAMARDE
eukprot:PRCOL_00006978-RA